MVGLRPLVADCTKQLENGTLKVDATVKVDSQMTEFYQRQTLEYHHQFIGKE